MVKSVQDALEYLSLDPLQIRIDAHRHYSEVPEDVEDDVIRAAQLGADDAVLDVGSGTGSFLARLRAGGHRGRLVALDASPAAVAAVSVVADHAVLGSASSLPFADADFTVVTARHMLYHVDEPDAAIAEAARVLTAGGRFVAAVNHLNTTPHIAAIVRGEVVRAGIEPPVLPGSRVHSANLPDMVRAVFGDVHVHRQDNALVYDAPQPVIRYGVALLSFYGVAPDAPQRADISASIARTVQERFASLDGPWREPKGYVVCSAIKS